MFDGKNIFITGGTGSFGQKLTQTILARYKPNKEAVCIISSKSHKRSSLHLTKHFSKVVTDERQTFYKAHGYHLLAPSNQKKFFNAINELT